MPVMICLIRRALCCICDGTFDIAAEEPLPERCIVCGSSDWQFGRESQDSVMIRQGLARQRKSLNPGARFLKRREHGRRQHQGFKPKPIESEEPESEN